MAFRRQYPHAELRIPTVPNFPLSSPITEEVASPTSSSSDERDLERTRPFEYLSKVTSRNPFVRKAEYERNSGSNQLETNAYNLQNGHQSSESGPGSLAAKNSGEKPVGLNLVTDFSSHPSAQAKTTEPPLMDLNDLKVLSEEREKERSTQKIKGILKKRNNQDYQHLQEDSPNPTRRRSTWIDMTPRISPKKKYKDELSPSDRPIMIGFSMPFDGSPDSQNEKPRELDIGDSQRTPLTPSIVVTPAKEDGFWTGLTPDYPRPRATSSIYSQPTPCLEDSETPVPPVPAIPAQHAAAKNEIISPKSPRRRSLASTRKHRSFSAGTVFEEDEVSRPGARSRSYSSSSVKRAFDRLSGIDGVSRLSVNTEYDRHQSQGWWTYLLSPLLGRSSTISSRKAPTDADRPPVPAIKTNLSESTDEWWEKEVSCFSPETPETAGVTRGEVASWQNCDTNPFADFNSITDPQAEPLGERNATSFMFPGRAIQGSAAEYYQACAHELFSGRSYFECLNHVCSITPKDTIPVSEPDLAADGTVNERGLLIDVDDMPRSEPHEDRSSLAPTSVSKTCSCGASVAADGSTVPSRSPKQDDPPKGIMPETPKTGSPEPQTRGVVPATPDDDNTPIESSPEPSRHGTPAPEPQARGGMDKAAPADYGNEKHQSFNPFAQQQPAAVPQPPPVTHVYIQQAPVPIQAPAPVVTTERTIPQYVMIPPPHHEAQPSQPQRPDPISPGFQQATEGSGSIPLGDMENSPAPAYTASRNDPATLPPRIEPVPITREATTNPFAERERIESRRRRHEKEEALGKKAGGLWRGRGCIPNKGCFGRSGREGRLKRRWYMAIAAFFLAIVIVAIVLAIVLTKKGDATPVQSQWLNLTGYPPMPTGIATVAAPEPRVQNSGCITPASLWSCALPKEQQDANKPYPANQPNFRVEIRFRNGTYPNSTTVASSPSKRLASRTPGSFDSSPSPPDMKEQAFLGNTTDNNTLPYAGEETPFYMTVLSPVPLSTVRNVRRSDNSFPDLESLIPSPDVDSDGTAAAANLYPLPESQPVRLYNRGQDSEHYGFYTYFDRSIFLSSSSPLDGSKSDPKDDDNGGSSKTKARVRCTWAQTRFLVQIWTQPGRSGKTLLSSNSTSSASVTPTSTAQSSSSTSTTTNSSASHFTRPGSFPYPITITLDRHGGEAKKKMLYCYGLESDLHINGTEKKLQIEDRDFGGLLVNPAPGIFNTSSSGSERDQDLGGFDGGTGGCACQWANWVSRS
ncbi:uncharacterized protein LDX57_007377 [Aspergillus melleus]|uniref:uncharacterized protein n=1 Tax=Aspergillus melleus TaxID=138277 RepID=UPI001E8D80F3|nr:uncharacterized protein LDX57_007377 [Aspergillus melleus]KAH8429705.1 hypothetical protein LDX57_007377 [Aspergillus melleus]